MGGKTRIAIAIGDPAGIGPEISLKAAQDPAVQRACRPVLVGDARVLQRDADACRFPVNLRVIARVQDADWSAEHVNVLDCAQTGLAAFEFGTVSSVSGHATLAFAATAIKAALAGEVDGVVAAPQNETAIARAGIAFDGYPSFVARETGTAPQDAYLMLCPGDIKIAHVTLHRSVRDALALVTRENVLRAIRAVERALVRLGAVA